VPQFLTVDYVEVVLLILLLLIGLPLNLMALIRLLKAYRLGQAASRIKQEETKLAFLLLKIHLTIVDLLLIVIYCPSKLAWLISYEWLGGNFLCKALQYAWACCFHLMSFMIVCIAIDRLKTVYRLMHIGTGTGTGRRPSWQSGKGSLSAIRTMITFCYGLATVCSLPQWLVWQTKVFVSWSQCTTFWHALRADAFLNHTSYAIEYPTEHVYTLVHLSTIFWLPFLLILSAYTYIVVCLFFYSLRPYASKTGTGFTTEIQSGGSTERLNLLQNGNGNSNTNNTLLVGNGNALKTERVPAWRIEMRSKMFNTSVLVIAAYLICWLPYNVLALANFLSTDVNILISVHLEILRCTVLFNTLLNPFIYGFNE